MGRPIHGSRSSLPRPALATVLAFLGPLSDGYLPEPPDQYRVAALSLIGPNPSHADMLGARFELSLWRPGHVEIAICDVEGRLVRRLCHETLGPGRYEYRWDGISDAGRNAPSGVYFAVLRAGSLGRGAAAFVRAPRAEPPLRARGHRVSR